jgi:hypothetical protein
MSTYSATITAAGIGQWIPALGATSSIQINVIGTDPLIISWTGQLSTANAIKITESALFTPAGDKTNMFALLSAGPLFIWGPATGQKFTIVST